MPCFLSWVGRQLQNMQGTLFLFGLDYIKRLKMQTKIEADQREYLCAYRWNPGRGHMKFKWILQILMKELVWFISSISIKWAIFKEKSYICFSLFKIYSYKL